MRKCERGVTIGSHRLFGSELSIVGSRSRERCEVLYYSLFDVIARSRERRGRGRIEVLNRQSTHGLPGLLSKLAELGLSAVDAGNR